MKWKNSIDLILFIVAVALVAGVVLYSGKRDIDGCSKRCDKAGYISVRPCVCDLSGRR